METHEGTRDRLRERLRGRHLERPRERLPDRPSTGSWSVNLGSTTKLGTNTTTSKDVNTPLNHDLLPMVHPNEVTPEAMQQRIQQARREAENLKERIKRKKNDLADRIRKYQIGQ
jgi:hypothetical protein